jgi:hypothetical protein
VPLLRRRPGPDPAVEAAWASFLRLAAAIDEGSRALLATVPTARRPGAPLDAGVAGFQAGLAAARAELPGWALPALAHAHQAAAAAIDAADALATGLADAAGELDFEARNELVGDLLEELAPLQDAERALRALRRRSSP